MPQTGISIESRRVVNHSIIPDRNISSLPLPFDSSVCLLREAVLEESKSIV